VKNKSQLEIITMKNFSHLYDTYIDSLFNFGCKFTSDREMLKDCIQDVFVKLYTKRDELSEIDNIKSYLLISLKNRIYDEFRRNVFLADTAVEDITVQPAVDNVEDGYLAKEHMQIENRMIKSLFSQLSPRQREALTLYYIEERKYEDICMIMGMNYQSVRNLMHRSLLRLRELAV
jgi:RNA polymerase sigma factor (sigma-70 family)